MPLLRWTYVQSMNVTRSRVALVADMDRLWAIGGYDGMKNLSTVSGKHLKLHHYTLFYDAGWDVQPWRRFLVLRGKHGIPRGRSWCGSDSHGLTSCNIAQHYPYHCNYISGTAQHSKIVTVAEYEFEENWSLKCCLLMLHHACVPTHLAKIKMSFSASHMLHGRKGVNIFELIKRLV